MSAVLPDPSLTRVCRLEATAGEPPDLGDIAQGRRRIVPLTGGTVTGPDLNGKLLPGSSADWQIVLPDGAAARIASQANLRAAPWSADRPSR